MPKGLLHPKATDRQKAFLNRHLGMTREELDALSIGQASVLIEQVIEALADEYDYDYDYDWWDLFDD